MTRGIARVALGDFDFVQTENVSYQVLIGLCAFQVCVCKSVSQVVKWDITCWRRRFDDGHRYPSFGKWYFIVCVWGQSSFTPSRTPNSIPITVRVRQAVSELLHRPKREYNPTLINTALRLMFALLQHQVGASCRYFLVSTCYRSGDGICQAFLLSFLCKDSHRTTFSGHLLVDSYLKSHLFDDW